jgi:ribonuclease HI
MNRDETWKAIRHAAGFSGGFAVWWGQHGLEPQVNVPLPHLCPPLDFAQGLFEGFQQFVHKYERQLASSRYQFASKRRADNMAYVFQDCKDDPLPQADTLLDRVEVGVEEVRPDDMSLVLVKPVTLLPDVSVVVDGKVLDVVAHSDDQVWTTSVEGIQPGQWLTQERAVSSDAEILSRFAAAWGARWLKLDHVLPSQWQQICGFLERTVQPVQWNFASWSISRFKTAVRSKKPKAAKGPDGVSQADLTALPDAACQAMVQLYEAVEQGSNWPLQLACGFVSSLAKHDQAQSVDEFRPVVVYSLPYRVWSSERAKEAMSCIADLLPNSVQGGVPARQAKSIWFELASALEWSYLNGDGLHGLLMDIQKCFNNIPRYPLWFALALMDFPQHILRAWVSFVSGQVRRFRVRRSVGAPVQSNCGLPEGCALSVFGMTIIDWMLDWWLQSLNVSVELRTFVDDWGVMFRDAAALPRLWSSMEEFTGQLDLAIDLKKTRVWSTETDARRSFRQGAVPVTLAARNLGAHQNFSKHCHNSVLLTRLSRMPPIWKRLRASHGPYRSKIAAIHMMAWPRALHGITVVHLGACQFKPLRAGAVRALKADRKGANPYLHLATTAFHTDPEAWSIMQTIRDTREMGNPDHVEPLLGLFSGSPERLPSNGPTAILVSRLTRLGWAVGGQGLVQDRLGSFSLLSISWDELVLRLKLSWGFVLAAELHHRPTFRGLEHVDLPELHRSLAVFSPADQVFLRCHLDGTLFTQNAKAKFKSNVTAKCPWCAAKDGFHHRAWVCPHFASCRTHLTESQLAVLPHLPSCLVDHGWPLILPEWEVVAGMLLQDDGLCRMSPANPPCDGTFPLLELFMDGTAAYPTDAKLRFAAWAVTVVTGQGTLDNQLLMGAHVTGLIQSPFRAELTATLQAVKWALQRNQSVRLWCDCQSVVRGLNRLLQKKVTRRNAPHSDLWGQLRELLCGREHLVQIRKVVSHCAVHLARDPIEQWAYWHNNLTDKAAEQINFRRPQIFWEAWLGLRSALDFHRKLHCAIQRVLLQTSKLAVMEQQTLKKQVPAEQVQVALPKVPTAWVIPTALVKRYGERNMQLLHKWWTEVGVGMMQSSHQLVYMAGIQLFFSFNIHSGYEGPWCFQKKWYSHETQVPTTAQTPWGARTGLFMRMFRCYLKSNHLVLPSKMARPAATSIGRWAA